MVPRSCRTILRAYCSCFARARSSVPDSVTPAAFAAAPSQIYVEKGFSANEARTVVGAMTRKKEYTEYFLDHMMVQELGQQPVDPDAAPWKNGLISFIAFIIFGTIPLIGYCVFYGTKYTNVGGQIGITAGVTVLCLFGLGAMQAYLIRKNIFVQGVYMAFNGSLAAASAYGIGKGLELAFNSSEPICGSNPVVA